MLTKNNSISSFYSVFDVSKSMLTFIMKWNVKKMHKIYSYRAHAESVISWMYTIGNQIIYSVLSVWSRAKKKIKPKKPTKKKTTMATVVVDITDEIPSH